MKRTCFVAVVSLAVMGVFLGSAQAACTPTGFYRDNINLTAALINPTATVQGDLDATGCNIGVYYNATSSTAYKVHEAFVHGANYFGVVNDGVVVDVTNSTIYDIGENPLNGDQHGVAVYFGTSA